jgi:hypothetical protein
MALQDNKRTNDPDIALIHTVVGGRGSASKSRSKKTGVKVVTLDNVADSKIAKTIQQHYAKLIDISLDEKERIVNAIHWLTHEYPGISIPGPVLYWMCYGGKTLKSADSDDVCKFIKKVGRARSLMLSKYNYSFLIKAGTIRGYTTREDHITDLSRVTDRITRATATAEVLSSVIGNPDTLKLDEDRRKSTMLLIQTVKSIGVSVRPLLNK